MEKRTLYAVVLVAILGAASFAVMRAPEKGEHRGAAARPFPVLKPDDITKLEITSAKDEKTTLERNGDGWHVTAPLQSGADAQSMKTLTEALGKLTFGDVVTENPAKHADLGVPDKGAAQLHVITPSLSVDMIIGNAVGGFTMVRLVGQKEVWQASNLFAYQVNKPPKDWRDHTIATITPANDSKLVVEVPGGSKVAFDKQVVDTKSEWKITDSTGDAPKVGSPFDASQPQTVVSAIGALRANDFADGKDPKAAGFEPPSLLVTVGPTTIEIGNQEGDDFYVRKAGAPTIYLVKKYLLEHVAYRPIDYREKSLVDIKSADITKLHVTSGKDSLTLVKKGDAWALDPEAPLDQTKAKTLVGGAELVGTSFVTDKTAKTELDKPRGTITVEGGGKKSVVHVGALTKDSGDYYVQREGSKDVLLVKKFVVERLMKKPSELVPTPKPSGPPPGMPHGGMPPGMPPGMMQRPPGH